jgi:FkbM family methyltransferase
MLRRIGAGVAASVEKLAGRRQLVRASRFLFDYARLDGPNDMARNGELKVQGVVLARSASNPVIAVDVGANVGAWTTKLLSEARRQSRKVRVHAFEPAEATYQGLRVKLHDGYDDCVTAVKAALSDHTGKGTLFKLHELAGANSLHTIAGNTEDLTRESVELCTLDDYCAQVGIDHIDLLKVDAEGHDHLVLRGASQLLARGAIDVAQFEYNHRWIGARRYLKDAFDDLGPLGYLVGKVTWRGIEWYPGWRPELETFREGNYVAVRPELRGWFPPVSWWLEA